MRYLYGMYDSRRCVGQTIAIEQPEERKIFQHLTDILSYDSPAVRNARGELTVLYTFPNVITTPEGPEPTPRNYLFFANAGIGEQSDSVPNRTEANNELRERIRKFYMRKGLISVLAKQLAG